MKHYILLLDKLDNSIKIQNREFELKWYIRTNLQYNCITIYAHLRQTLYHGYPFNHLSEISIIALMKIRQITHAATWIYIILIKYKKVKKNKH